MKLGDRVKALRTYLGYMTERKASKSFDVVQRYDSVQRFVIAYAKMGQFVIEVSPVARKEVSMSTIKRAIDLEHSY